MNGKITERLLSEIAELRLGQKEILDRLAALETKKPEPPEYGKYKGIDP